VDVIYYGPFFDLVARAVAGGLSIGDPRPALLLKHLLTFLYFAVAVFFFYRLGKNYFREWVPAYLACCLLVIHPRIFADAFNNPKDLPFLSSFIIAAFTLQWFVSRQIPLRALVHGLTTAMSIDIRILGILIPCMTVLFVASDFLGKPRNGAALKVPVISLAVYILGTALFTVLLWPLLWETPLSNFLAVFSRMSQFPHHSTELYLGSKVSCAALPWHYIFVWIGVTTPLTILVLFVMGIFDLFKALHRQFKEEPRESLLFLLPYVWLFVPVAAVIVMKSTLYNGWRQMYFVYPAVALIAVRGLLMIRNAVDFRRAGMVFRGAVGILLVAVVLDIASVASFMIRNHPNQHLYFNQLAGGLHGAKGRFEWDYYGITHRSLMESLVAQEPGSEPILVASLLPNVAWSMLPAEERSRVHIVQTPPYVGPDKIRMDGNYYFLASLWGGLPYWGGDYPVAAQVQVDGETVAVALKVPAGGR